MSGELTREEALRVLELPASAPSAAVKRAYRRLARRHHPDVGGDPATFHRIRLAVERLLEERTGPEPPLVSRGRPSRRSWQPVRAVDETPVDTSGIAWDAGVLAAQSPLARGTVAAHLASAPETLVRPLQATSRAPGSRLNRLAGKLSSEVTSQLEVRAGRDDRGAPVVVLAVSGGHRRARRALDRASLDGPWVRVRGSSRTELRATLAPSPGARATAVRAVDQLEDLLERLAWPLSAWTATGG